MYLKIKAIPGSKRESVEETGPNRLTIAVREKAERNMANARIMELVARHFGVPPQSVRIISGHTSPSKMLSVDTEREARDA